MTPQPGWFRRYWKWLVVGACAGFITLLALAAFSIYALVMGFMRASAPYQHALAAARSNPAVEIALGDPIKPGFMLSGSIQLKDDGGGTAGLRIPLHGARRDGTLLVRGERNDGHWHYSVLSVRIKATGRRIDLLGAPLPQDRCRPANAINCKTTSA